MSYDPFARGPHPVGVRSAERRDPKRDRVVPIELWYPASAVHAGQDLDPDHQDRYRTIPAAPETSQTALRDVEAAPGSFPLVCFSHGFAGHRRQTTHLCSHLASHGYLVVAVDHVGNTIVDMMKMASAAMQKDIEAPDVMATMKQIMDDRPLDVRFAIDCVQSGDAGIGASSVDAESGVGVAGHSFGGWTTLRVAGDDPRVRAALPLAPAGGTSALGGGADLLQDALDLDWQREVPTLYLVADHDTLLPLEGMRELFARTKAPKQMIVLRDADHMHFCDRVEETHEMFRMMGGLLLGGVAEGLEGGASFADVLRGTKPSTELCPGEHAYTLLQGLGVAHMDAHLKRDARAVELLAGDLAVLLASRGVTVDALG